MAEFDLPGVPGVEWRGEPDIEAEIGLEVTHKAGGVSRDSKGISKLPQIQLIL